MQQMRTVLDYVGKREGFAIPDDTVRLIAEDANGNVRKAILVLEALKMQKCVRPSTVLLLPPLPFALAAGPSPYFFLRVLTRRKRKSLTRDK